jgi:arginase family enzyme
MDRAVTCLRGRTSDRTDLGGEGAEALARLLGGRVVGAPGDNAIRDWSEDLPASRPVLEAGVAALEEAFAAGALPVLTASDCTICVATLPAVLAHEPDVHVAWLDAHGDYNTPATTPSGFLGGMCLAAACGRWDAGGWPGTLDPARVHLLGIRDLDPAEEEAVDSTGVRADVPEGVPLFVHLDADVLNGELMPSEFPAPGGWDEARLTAQLAELAAGCRIVGIEVTALGGADRAPLIARAIEPLLG